LGPKVKTIKPTAEIGHNNKSSLKKQKPQSLLSAAHRAISNWKFDSLPVNRLTPIKIKFATATKHLNIP
jgi:hypothetical protein